MKLVKKKSITQKRRWRIRKKIQGSVAAPRIIVHFSHQHIYAQAIDDENGKVIVAVSTLSKDIRDQKLRPNVAGAPALGNKFGELAKKAELSKVVFDRGGRRYHGCVKAFAEAVRAAGLIF